MESTADMNSTTQQFTTLDTQRRVKHSGLFLYEFNDVSKRLKGEEHSSYCPSTVKQSSHLYE